MPSPEAVERGDRVLAAVLLVQYYTARARMLVLDGIVQVPVALFNPIMQLVSQARDSPQ